MTDITQTNSFVSQAFIDAVDQHNGRGDRKPDRKPVERKQLDPERLSLLTKRLRLILQHLSSDLGYKDWFQVGLAIYSETGGSDDGYALFDDWSSRGDKYEGPDETFKLWNSIKQYDQITVTIGSIIHLLKEQGVDTHELLQTIDTEIELEQSDAKYDHQQTTTDAGNTNNLNKDMTDLFQSFSLKGQSNLLEAEATEATYVMDSW